MAFGQYLAGMAFNSAGLGLVHAPAHQPGATHNLPHGVCNAILLPIIENFNRPNAVARFARVAQAMGVDTRGMSDEAASMSAIQAIRDLSARVGIPSGFSQLGVTKADIEGWLDKALADPCAPCNPRTASRDEVRELYRGFMIRKAFVMQVNPDAHEEYARRHNPIWPELEAVLKAHGAHHYAIYLDKARNLLFATVEIESEERWNAVANTDVCQRWWKHMADVMPSNPDNSPVSAELEEVFYGLMNTPHGDRSTGGIFRIRHAFHPFTASLLHVTILINLKISQVLMMDYWRKHFNGQPRVTKLSDHVRFSAFCGRVTLPLAFR